MRVCVTWVEDFCPEVQTGTRGLRPCLTLTVSLGPCSTRPAVQRNHCGTALFTCSRLYLWWRGDAGSGLGAYLPSDLSSLCQNPPEENVGCYSKNCWEISAPGMPLPLTTICAAAATSSTYKQILQCFCHAHVSSEDRSLNKFLWLWQSPEHL